MKRQETIGGLLIFAAAAILLLGGCESDTQVNFIPDNYREWPKTTDTKLQFPIPGHEDNLRKIYINPEGLEYQATKAGDNNEAGTSRYFFPEGTVIVKEIYEGFNPDPDEPPKQLTVMVKKPEHPEAQGGWLWIAAPSAEGPEQIIENEFCLTCHSNANEAHPYNDGNPKEEFRDYVFYLPEPE